MSSILDMSLDDVIAAKKQEAKDAKGKDAKAKVSRTACAVLPAGRTAVASTARCCAAAPCVSGRAHEPVARCPTAPCSTRSLRNGAKLLALIAKQGWQSGGLPCLCPAARHAPLPRDGRGAMPRPSPPPARDRVRRARGVAGGRTLSLPPFPRMLTVLSSFSGASLLLPRAALASRAPSPRAGGASAIAARAAAAAVAAAAAARGCGWAT